MGLYLKDKYMYVAYSLHSIVWCAEGTVHINVQQRLRVHVHVQWTLQYMSTHDV